MIIKNFEIQNAILSAVSKYNEQFILADSEKEIEQLDKEIKE